MVATATIKRNGAATFGATIERAVTGLFSMVATFLKYGIAALPLYPAARINWDAAPKDDMTGAIAGIGIAVFGAICIENARHSWFEKQRGGAAVWGAIGLVLLAISYGNGLSNFSTNSDHSRDLKSSQQTAAKTSSSQRSQLEKRRTAQVAIVAKPLQSVRGMQIALSEEAPVMSIQAEIDETKAAKAGFWRASDGCKPEKLYSPEAKDYCREIADLGGKKAAAETRDQIDVDLREIDNKAGRAEVPSSVDPFADAVADFIALLGYDLKDKDDAKAKEGKDEKAKDGSDAKAKLLISRIRDYARALGVEILAFFGPSGILQLLSSRGSHQNAPAPQVQPQPQRKPERPSKATVAPIVAEANETAPAAIPVIVATSTSQNDDPELDAFYESRLEDVQGSHAPSTPVFKAWEQHCADRGIDPGSQKAFSMRLQKRVSYDRNNGRPRYMHVRLKPVQHQAPAHGLRLAVNNA
jgi:hypothetical protein